MSKPSTPVRRSKVGVRPGSREGGEIPLTASMEVLPPDPCASPMMAYTEPSMGRSHELHGAGNGAKLRTPKPGSQLLSRTHSNEGRRSALGPHEVIPLTSTTSKSFNASHAPLLQPFAEASDLLPPQHVPYSPMQGSDSSGHGEASSSQRQHHSHASGRPDTATSHASSRFNPMTEGDMDSPRTTGARQPELQLPSGASGTAQQGGLGARDSCVTIGGSAALVAQRAAAAATAGGSSRRYSSATGSGASQQRPGSRGGGEEDEVGLHRQPGEEHSEVPGTPASMASGRGGGTFFTDLRRSFGNTGRPGVNESQELGGDEDDLDDFGNVGGIGPHASRPGLMSLTSSRLNPMQSPSSSENGDDDDVAFAEYAGEAIPGAGNGRGTGIDGGASSSALTDYPNPLMTPEDSRAATPLPIPAMPTATSISVDASSTGEARRSLLLVIRGLYVTEPPPPSSAGSSRPGTAASEVLADEELVAGAADDADVLAASRAAVAALSARSDGQQLARRSELGEYMTALQELKDDSGGRLVELPADWGVMLERLFRQRRAEYATLEGWLGPRRFEDLPINQLPSDHPDPRVVEGLARIHELDGVLNDKLISALISHRETFPEQWMEQERKRLDRHTKAVEEALKRERHKRLRAARIARAVTSLEGPASSVAGDVSASHGSLSSLLEGSQQQHQSAYARMFVLRPEEEALVEQVMQRNDDDGSAVNPFDLDSAATYGGGPAASIDDIELELDMLLPSAAASAAPTPSAASAVAAAMLPRPFSAAQGVDGEPGCCADWERPLYATASSMSLSRPGTASGRAGGLSALAAVALHGHPALLAATGLRDSISAGVGLLPGRVYDDPKAAARALRAINARLAAFESEHVWDEDGGLADFKSVAAPTAAGAEAAAAAPAGLATAVTGPPGLPPRPPSPTRSVRSTAGGPAPSMGGSTVTASGQKDYLREERLAKELVGRERDVDTALRSLKTGEVVRLGEATLKALVEQCRRLQELNEHRRKVEEEEDAARKVQRLQQQHQQPLASSSGRTRESVRASEESVSGGGRPSADSTPAAASGPGGGGGATRNPSRVGRTSAAAGGSTGPAAAGSRRNSDPAGSCHAPAPGQLAPPRSNSGSSSGTGPSRSGGSTGGKGTGGSAAAHGTTVAGSPAAVLAVTASVSATTDRPPKSKPPTAKKAVLPVVGSVANLLQGAGGPPPPPPPPPP